MKHIQFKKIKKEDIKAYWKARKERRQAILEKRRNSAFAQKMKPVYKVMNQFSLVFHVLYACVLNLTIEAISRHSLFDFYYVFTCISCKTPCVYKNFAECILAWPWNYERLYAVDSSYSV